MDDMGIDVSLALREAAGRLTTVSGMIVAVLFVLAGIVELVVTQTIASRLFEVLSESVALPPEALDQVQNQYETSVLFDLGLGLEPAAAIFLFVFVLVIAFRVVGIRVFASTSDGMFPGEAVRYRFFVAFLFVLLFEALLIATTIGLLVGPALLVGAITDPAGAAGNGGLLLLALYLLVLGAFIAMPIFLYFARQEMVLGDENTIAAIGKSYRIAKANLAAVFALLALIFVLNLVGGMVLGALLGDVSFGPLVTTTFQRIVAVFGIAASTRAYMQTR